MNTMYRRYILLMLLPASCLSLFLVEVLRQHGYQALFNPLAFGAAVLLGVASVLLLWVGYSLLLSRFASLNLYRALFVDCLCHMPFLVSLAYFLPAARRFTNVGTFLFFIAVVGVLVCRLAVLLYYRGRRLRIIFSHPYVPLALVVALAAVLRLSLIAANRFHGDEALYSHWGLLIASGKDVFLRYGVIVDKPPVFLYTLALFFKIFGHNETAARLPNILASLGSIVFLYHIALELAGRRVALLSALFLALSPFDIQFAPTAFTDPFMVGLVLASCLLALKRWPVLAGLAAGLAVMTKPTGVFFLPLIVFFAALPCGKRWLSKRLGIVMLGLAAGFLAVCLAVVCWDVVIRVNCVNFLTASAARYGGLRVVPLERIVPRLRAWLGQSQYLTGSTVLNGLLVAFVPLLLIYDLWKRRVRSGWLLDWAFAAFFLYFVAVHTLLSFSVWDRYILGLAPVVSLLMARVVLVPFDALIDRSGERLWRKLAYFTALGVFLAAVLLHPTRTALRYDYPVGGDHGAFQGINVVADYFKANAEPGSVVFHKWLAWHYSFYMFDQPLEYYWYPDHAFVLDTSRRLPSLHKYVVFPSWTSSDELRTVLHDGGWELNEQYVTYRPDGTLSFTIYRIQPADQ
jgi:4-amino-4-deoxy-L-arabinose transferase-like glycosyltransferase